MTAPWESAGRFANYSTGSLAARCRMQARENLDPEYCQFMNAVADRLEAAQVGAHPEGGDALAAPFMSDAVGRQADAPTPSSPKARTQTPPAKHQEQGN